MSRGKRRERIFRDEADRRLFRAALEGTVSIVRTDTCHDDNNVLLKTISGHTDHGVIDEVWNLIPDGSGSARTDPEFNSLVAITPSTPHPNHGNDPPSTVTYTYPYHFLRSLNYGDGAFTMAFGWNSTYWLSSRQNMIQENVVDVLFDPGDDNQYNNTLLNSFDGTCFFMYTTGAQTAMLDDLSNPNVENFYWDGHGGQDSFGSATGEKDANAGLAMIGRGDVNNALLNVINASATGWTARQHPYRLVIMNSCSSASDSGWANAFGIPSTAHDEQWFEKQVCLHKHSLAG